MHRRSGLAGIALLLAVVSPMAAGEFPKFRMHEIDPQVGKVCYALTLADVDGDGRPDIVAVTENRVLWYRNPDWKPHVIIENQTELDNVCIAPFDITGDGKVEFALGAGWTKVGTIQWLSRGKTLDEKWQVHHIAVEPWTHRMRFADVLGTGREQLVVSPLNRTTGEGVRLLAFEIPKNPKTDRWPPTVMDHALNRMHNHWHVDWNGDSVMETLTASQEGVHLVRRGNGGFERIQLGKGTAGEKPDERGAGEIKLGRFKGGRRYIATIEPMHGHSVVVYLEPESGDKETLWPRHVLDDTLNWGHAVSTADLDGDGNEELIIGQRDPGPGPVKGPGVYVYQTDATGTKWTKHVLDDGGVAVEDLVAGDLTGNGRIDIVAGGRATHNVRLYVNQGQ